MSKVKDKVLEVDEPNGNVAEIPKIVKEITYENPKPTLKETAFSVAKDPKDGNWYVFEVEFNINDVNVKKASEGNIRAIIWERFMIAAANKLTGEF